ncbi:MAG TPA: polymer-forming cytoskeletal protein [Candidatus Binataceae bacterium]|nr:polymer-forming cytoskeletal protein [Candidatus Binataceae bacterium]
MALFNNKEQDRNARAEVLPKTAPLVQATPPSATPAVASSPEKPSMRAGVAPSTAGAYLDGGSKISGKLSFDGPSRIDGQVDGEINAKDSLTIGETAVVTAQIRAASIVVAGKVSGDISASNRIEIRPSARIIGNLAAPVLVVHEGATFEGHCSMTPEGVRDERKVTMFPKEERLSPVNQVSPVNQAVGQKQA